MSRKLLITDYDDTPIGHVWQAAELIESVAATRDSNHTLGSYAIVYITSGRAWYQDARTPRTRLRPGDVIVVLPEWPHAYGPQDGATYDQVYLAFKGPVFDLWRQQKLLPGERLLHHLDPVPQWRQRFIDATCANEPPTVETRLKRVVRVQELLIAIADTGSRRAAASSDRAWALEACETIEKFGSDAAVPWEALSQRLGMSYHAFRKRFTRELGISPGRYRAKRVIDRACGMLLEPGSSIKGIADRLGFSSEFHFSHRFKAIVGMPPSEFRRGGIDHRGN